MNAERSSVIDTILKLSELANPEGGGFQNEIEVAAAKIQLLMEKHSITEEEIELMQVEVSHQEMEREFINRRSDYVFKQVKQWHWALARVIARMTHTKHYVNRGRTHSKMAFFGEPDNTEAAAKLYAEWVPIIDQTAKEALDKHWKHVMKEYDYKGFLAKKRAGAYGRWVKFNDTLPYEMQTTYFRTSWIQGCLAGISQRLNERANEHASKFANALAIYDEEVEKRYKEMSEGWNTVRTSGPNGYSSAGYSEGMKAGRGINLDSSRLQ